MKCPKCNTKNSPKANYCMSCKRKFTEEEQEKAYNKTIFHFFDKLEDLYSKINLEFITDHILFKIGSLLLVLGIGIYFYFTKGINTTILDSKNYEIYKYKNSKEYYLVVKDNIEKASLNLYIPNRAKKIEIIEYDETGKEIKKTNYKKNKEFKLTPSTKEYYVIQTTYSNQKEESLIFYIYKESDIEKPQ